MKRQELINKVLRLLLAQQSALPGNIRKVIQAKNPDTTHQSVEDEITQCKQILDTALKLANEEWGGSISRSTVLFRIKQLFPFIPDDLVQDLHAKALAAAAK